MIDQTPPRMSLSLSQEITYADSGVDTQQTDSFTNKIAKIADSTQRPGAIPSIGGFAAMVDPSALSMTDPILLLSTDGVGSKIALARTATHWHHIGIDLVAMCVNDIAVHGGQAVGFLDYVATHRFAPDILEPLIQGIASGCRTAHCALIGGETAIMPTLYTPGKTDLAGFALGAVERERQLPLRVNNGDIAIGLASSGLHANGFTLIHKLLERMDLSENDIDEPDEQFDGQSLRDVLLTPTCIYHPLLGLTPDRVNLLDDFWPHIHALAHITGGGLSNVERVLPDHLALHLQHLPPQPPIFKWLEKTELVCLEEIRHVFNVGIGMILICHNTVASDILEKLKDRPLDINAFKIGIVGPRSAGMSVLWPEESLR